MDALDSGVSTVNLRLLWAGSRGAPTPAGPLPNHLPLRSATLVVLGVARGQLRRPGGLILQAAGMLGFGAIALATLYVDTGLGGYLVAFALLGHAVWDAFHYLRDRVVARSYAEFCGIVDLGLGVAILLFLV
jgi:hypothetical protein